MNASSTYYYYYYFNAIMIIIICYTFLMISWQNNHQSLDNIIGGCGLKKVENHWCKPWKEQKSSMKYKADMKFLFCQTFISFYPSPTWDTCVTHQVWLFCVFVIDVSEKRILPEQGCSSKNQDMCRRSIVLLKLHIKTI